MEHMHLHLASLCIGLITICNRKSGSSECSHRRVKDLTGGQLIIETEVEDAAQKFEEIIKEKRIGLGIDKGGDAVC